MKFDTVAPARTVSVLRTTWVDFAWWPIHARTVSALRGWTQVDFVQWSMLGLSHTEEVDMGGFHLVTYARIVSHGVGGHR